MKSMLLALVVLLGSSAVMADECPVFIDASNSSQLIYTNVCNVVYIYESGDGHVVKSHGDRGGSYLFNDDNRDFVLKNMNSVSRNNCPKFITLKDEEDILYTLDSCMITSVIEYANSPWLVKFYDKNIWVKSIEPLLKIIPMLEQPVDLAIPLETNTQ